MYDSLQGVYRATLFVAPVVEVDLPDRTHLGRWGPSPRCYTMGHLVRPRSSSRNAQLMGKRKKDKNMLKEMDGKKILRYDQIWFELRWYIVSSIYCGFRRKNSYVEASTANSHWSLWRSFPPSARQRLFWQNWAFVGRSWWEWLKCFLMCCFGVCFILFHHYKAYLALQPAVPSWFIHPFRPISFRDGPAHSLGKHNFLPAQGFPRMLAWP